MKKSVWIVIGIVIVLIIIGIVFAFNNKPVSNSNIKNLDSKESVVKTENSINPVDSNPISTSELAKHNKANDCWVVYKNQVYDITGYLNMHPGGSGTITTYCGNSGFESAFLGKHGSSFETKLKSNSILKGEFK